MISLILIAFCLVNLASLFRVMYKDRASFLHIVAVVRREQSFKSACVNTFLIWSIYLVAAIFLFSFMLYLINGYF